MTFETLVDQLFVREIAEFGFRQCYSTISGTLMGSESIVASPVVVLRLVVDRDGVWLGYVCRDDEGRLRQCPLDGLFLDRYESSARPWPGMPAESEDILSSRVERDLKVLAKAMVEMGRDFLQGTPSIGPRYGLVPVDVATSVDRSCSSIVKSVCPQPQELTVVTLVGRRK